MAWWFAASVYGFFAPASADAARKALVIGIDRYQYVAPLQRAVNDAQ
jgi:hypothetical protein